MSGLSGIQLARVGERSSDTDLLESLARARMRMLLEAVQRAWGGTQLDQRLVICDGPGFEELFPDHSWWIQQINPEWSDSPTDFEGLFELLGVAAPWPTTDVTVYGDAPGAGEHVVALHAPRMVQVCDDLSISVTGLFDAVVAHEYSHHADGVLTQQQPSSPVDIFRAEHVAQLQAWSALTLLPRLDGDRAKQAVLELSHHQPRAYTRFRDLPTVEATLPLGDDQDDPLLIPVDVLASQYPELNDQFVVDGIDTDTADTLRAAATSTVVLIDSLEEHRSQRFRMVDQLADEEKWDLIDGDNPPEGVQLARGVYRLLDVQGTSLRLAPLDGQRARKMRYAYTEASGPLKTTRRQSTWGGRLLEG